MYAYHKCTSDNCHHFRSVKDSKGVALASATVIVEFPDAGIKQSLTTRSDGRFTVPNLRVGGPYKVTVTHVGHQQSVTDNIFLELGLNNTIDIVMQEETTELGGVTVTAQSKFLIIKEPAPLQISATG